MDGMVIVLVLLGFCIAYCAGAVTMALICSGKVADMEEHITTLERVK